MKIIEYMNRLSKTEAGEYGGSLVEIINDEFYDMSEFGKTSELFSETNLWGKRNQKEEIIYNEWSNFLENMYLELTPFRDANFLRTFLKDIPKEEQFKYVYNTTLYSNGKDGYDSKYVILTRRALPSLSDKPEQFWTSAYIEVMNGLTAEIPKGSPHRLHSVILVTTLNVLEQYGFAFNYGGSTDGEVMINYAPFKRDDILFVHKSDKEIADLDAFLYDGGTHLSEVLNHQKQLAEERQKHYQGSQYNAFGDKGKAR